MKLAKELTGTLTAVFSVIFIIPCALVYSVYVAWMLVHEAVEDASTQDKET